MFPLLLAAGIFLNACSGCDRSGEGSVSTRLYPTTETKIGDFVKEPIVGTWVSDAYFDEASNKRLLFNFRMDGVVEVRWAFPGTNELTGEADFPYKVDGVEVKIGSGEQALTYPFGANDDVLIMDGIKYIKTKMEYFKPKRSQT